jgi:hypothetical protein
MISVSRDAFYRTSALVAEPLRRRGLRPSSRSRVSIWAGLFSYKHEEFTAQLCGGLPRG